jgi:hypothetical protein
MRRTAFTSSVLLGFLLAGCGSEPSRPAPVAGVPVIDLELEVSSTDGSAASPITVKAIATNRGTAQAFTASLPRVPYCSCDGFTIDVLGPDGTPMVLYPCGAASICLCVGEVVEPGASAQHSQIFTGTTYRVLSTSPECKEEAAPSGDYVAVARYTYYAARMGDAPDPSSRRVLERRVAIHWNGP